jgi:AP2-associated kinase
MFLFPVSKASSEGDPLSAGLPAESTSSGLLPPDEPNPRAGARRTSISNMVQHYEAIGGKIKPRSPPVASKPPAFKAALRQTDGNRFSKGQHARSPSITKKNENANASAEARVSAPNRSSISVPGHKKTSTLPDARTIIPNALRTSPVGMPDLGRPKRAESPVPPSQTPPLKSSSVSELSLSDSRTRKFPSRKSTLSEESTKVDDGRSASPEQPYQGVGKLIDQWQRKTAEAEAPRSPVKSRPGPKRVGTVNRGS